MSNTVPVLSVVFMLADMLMGVILPLGLYIILRKKYSCGHGSFWVGCAVMLVFALILEQLAHSLILSSSLGSAITGNIWLYGLYGGLMAGLFEETGALPGLQDRPEKEPGQRPQRPHVRRGPRGL